MCHLLSHTVIVTETNPCIPSELANNRLVNDRVPLRDSHRLRMSIPTKRADQHRLRSTWLSHSRLHQQTSRSEHTFFLLRFRLLIVMMPLAFNYAVPKNGLVRSIYLFCLSLQN